MEDARAKIGRRRTLVIPKRIAEKVGIDEGTVVTLRVDQNRIVIEPEKDAVWLAIHGKKVAKVSLKELEEESLERQKELRGIG